MLSTILFRYYEISSVITLKVSTTIYVLCVLFLFHIVRELDNPKSIYTESIFRQCQLLHINFLRSSFEFQSKKKWRLRNNTINFIALPLSKYQNQWRKKPIYRILFRPNYSQHLKCKCVYWICCKNCCVLSFV